MAKSECRKCGCIFYSLGGFDKHRVGSYGEAIYDEIGRVTGYTRPTRRCLSKVEMEAIGMVLKNGLWTTGEVVVIHKPAQNVDKAAS